MLVLLALCCASLSSPGQSGQVADEALVELGDSLWNMVFQDPRQAMRLAGELMARSKEANYYKGMLQAEKGIAESYYALQMLDSSTYWYGIALRRTLAADDLRNSPAIHGQIGTNYLEQGLSDSCLHHMNSALGIATSLNDSALICTAYMRMGKAQRRLYRQTEAIRNLQTALRYCNGEESRNQLALANLTLAMVHDEQQDRSTAMRGTAMPAASG